MLSTTFAVLRPTPGKRLQQRAVARHRAAMLGDQLFRQRDHVLRLVAVEPDGLDQVAHLRFAKLHHLFRRVGRGEQSRRRLVDAGIGRLRRQHHRDQQRERIDVLPVRPSAPDRPTGNAGTLPPPRPASRAGYRRARPRRQPRPAPWSIWVSRPCRPPQPSEPPSHPSWRLALDPALAACLGLALALAPAFGFFAFTLGAVVFFAISPLYCPG